MASPCSAGRSKIGRGITCAKPYNGGMPTLYVVATPIGNLEDVTLRALRVLAEVDLIAAEDTRVTRKLLAKYDISTRTTSYHEHNRHAKLPALLAALRRGDVALVSDAGTPGINDPGWELVDAAASAGVEVAVVPGASVVSSAISAAGMAVDQFVYLGFLPRPKGARRRLLESVAREARALVVLEAPHRLRAALTDLLDALGDRPLAVCRELTKLHEEVFRGSVSSALDYFSEPKGEITLVIAGFDSSAESGAQQVNDAREMLAGLRADGATARDSVARVVAASGLWRRVVYEMWLETAVEHEKRS